MPPDTDRILQYLSADSGPALARLKEFLSIPSVSANPAHKDDIGRAAAWVARQFQDLGLSAEVCPTKGHPVVLARTRDGDVLTRPHARPGVLFYGHYDVQPADPLALWTTPPFEPTVRDGAIHARGASDDKGQVACFLEALRAWRQNVGKFPCAITAMIEGEEEIGSVHLRAFLEERRATLQSHSVVVISDTAMWDAPAPGSANPKSQISNPESQISDLKSQMPAAIPAITYGLRGLLYFDIQLHGPARDLHSGVYGGTVPNPATELAAVLGRLFDSQHRVTIPGFYDDVASITDAERAHWAKLGFDEHSYLAGVGIAKGYGEAGFSTLERRWCRPSCDINGLYGGYGGPGAKTVLPAFAGAKVSFRIVPDQTAAKIGAAFRGWLESQDVHGCTWRIEDLSGCDPVVVPIDSPHVAAAARAITKAAGRGPVMIRDGATIPVVTDFKRVLGLDSLLVGFGRTDDRIHSPDEKFDLSGFALGCRTHALLLAELA